MRKALSLLLLVVLSSRGPALEPAGDPNLVVVRIKSHGASGTIIGTTDGKSWILSCAHMFLDHNENLDKGKLAKKIVIDGPEQPYAQRKVAAGKKGPGATTSQTGTNDPKAKKEIQGIFVVDKTTKKVDFKPVETGIQGSTDMEVLGGLTEGQEIVTGSYKVLRTLKVGAKVKVDNSVAKKDDNS